MAQRSSGGLQMAPAAFVHTQGNFQNGTVGDRPER
jgi:hypothetical protein